MAEEGYYYESRFVCKLCNKRFPCGKSLGGHMRSHHHHHHHHVVVNSSAESAEELIGHDEQLQSSTYVLRENPKKTWRASVPVGGHSHSSRIPLPQDKICKQCGKGFQSMKALCGHMACHSERDRDRDNNSNKNFKDDSSWTTSENHKTVFDSCSDTDQEEEEAEERRTMRTRSSSSKNKKFVEKSHFFTSSNNVSHHEIDGQDQEEVAMCLMLLSRDFGNNNNNNSVVESSDNNSVILETTNKSSSIGNKKLKGKVLDDENVQVEDSDSGYFLNECGKVESSDLSANGFRKSGVFGYQCKINGEYELEFKKRLKVIKNELRKFSKDDDDVYDDIDDNDDGRMASNFAGIESRKRKYHHHSSENQESKSKYECYNCKKTFKSYQALGGHRPCHKRTNPFHEPAKYESGENSLDESAADYKKKKSSAKKNKPNNKSKGHVCPFCDRVFKNGQALGGHKRSHFIGGGRLANDNQSCVVKPKARRDLLDLNLPAPEADDGDNE